MAQCYSCHKPLDVTGRPRRQEDCPNCGADLHCCLNCQFHDEKVHNQCRETQADWVSNKEKANFCDFFVFSGAARGSAGAQSTHAASRKMDDLFKKPT